MDGGDTYLEEQTDHRLIRTLRRLESIVRTRRSLSMTNQKVQLFIRDKELKPAAVFVLFRANHGVLAIPLDALGLGKHDLHECLLAAERNLDNAVLDAVGRGFETEDRVGRCAGRLEFDEAVHGFGRVAFHD